MEKEVSRFKDCLEFIYEMEGGFVNDPLDKGGMTFKGICRKLYPALSIWSSIDSLIPNKSLINALRSEEIDSVYKQCYWDKCCCDVMLEPLDLIVFDTAVNMGVGRAKQFLAKTIEPDLYLYLRKDYYLSIVEKNPSQSRFINGWINRLKKLSKKSGVIVDLDIDK